MVGYEFYVQRLDAIRKIARDGSEYWMARDIQRVLAYKHWEGFSDVIGRAITACESAEVPVDNHFRQTPKMVEIGSGARREQMDWFLSRYACYVIAMNGDSAKAEVAHAQTYFAVQTRNQEIQERLTDQEKRVQLRDRVRSANRALQGVAHEAGVARFGIFQDAGYKGLYGGLGLQAIKKRKGLHIKDDLLDRAGRAELAANEFRITQTEEKIERDRVRGEENAIATHRQVGERVRRTIQELGGTLPENLKPEPSIKKLKKRGQPPNLLHEPTDS